MVLREGPYVSHQATSDTSLEHEDFELSCDEDVENFNKFMRPRRATRCFDVLPKIFNNAYKFKKIEVLSTLSVFIKAW